MGAITCHTPHKESKNKQSNYRTIIQARWSKTITPMAEELLAEERASFRAQLNRFSENESWSKGIYNTGISAITSLTLRKILIKYSARGCSTGSDGPPNKGSAKHCTGPALMAHSYCCCISSVPLFPLMTGTSGWDCSVRLVLACVEMLW